MSPGVIEVTDNNEEKYYSDNPAEMIYQLRYVYSTQKSTCLVLVYRVTQLISN